MCFIEFTSNEYFLIVCFKNIENHNVGIYKHESFTFAM